MTPYVTANSGAVEGALSTHLMKWITQKGYPVLTVSRDYDAAAPPEKNNVYTEQISAVRDDGQ